MQVASLAFRFAKEWNGSPPLGAEPALIIGSSSIYGTAISEVVIQLFVMRVGYLFASGGSAVPVRNGARRVRSLDDASPVGHWVSGVPFPARVFNG
jgi:hypothetical protein